MASAIDLGGKDIGKLLFRLSVPAIFAQLSTLLYNVVDRIFIGQMTDGALAMAALGIVMPITMLISAFSVLIGNGGAPLVAICIGEGNLEQAKRILGNSMTLLLSLSVTLTVLFLLFGEPFLYALGASDNTITLATSYLNIYVWGTVFVQIVLGLNPYINTQGHTKIGMVSLMIGSIVNIVFDYLFIVQLDMGIKGAALATVMGQFCGAVWVCRFLFSSKNQIPVKAEHFKLDFSLVLRILTLGSTSFIMQSMETLIMLSYNRQMLRFGGDTAVGAMSVMNTLILILTLPVSGICRGAQPILGYNFGAKNYTNINKALKIQFVSCISYPAVMLGLIYLFPEAFIGLFATDTALIEATKNAAYIYLLGNSIIGLQIACQQSFIAFGKAKQSLIIVLLRKVVLLIPLIYILPNILSSNPLEGVFLAQPITDAISTTIAVVCFYQFYQKNLVPKKET